jgi:hypothetical protein
VVDDGEDDNRFRRGRASPLRGTFGLRRVPYSSFRKASPSRRISSAHSARSSKLRGSHLPWAVSHSLTRSAACVARPAAPRPRADLGREALDRRDRGGRCCVRTETYRRTRP